MRVQVTAHPGHSQPYALVPFRLTSADQYQSCFRNRFGRTVLLTVIPNESGYGLQYDPTTDSGYMVLIGPWDFAVEERTVDEDDVICGISGLEYLQVSSGGQMKFESGGPAFAPSFPLGKDGSSKVEPLLISQAPGRRLETY